MSKLYEELNKRKKEVEDSQVDPTLRLFSISYDATVHVVWAKSEDDALEALDDDCFYKKDGKYYVDWSSDHTMEVNISESRPIRGVVLTSSH